MSNYGLYPGDLQYVIQGEIHSIHVPNIGMPYALVRDPDTDGLVRVKLPSPLAKELAVRACVYGGNHCIDARYRFRITVECEDVDNCQVIALYKGEENG